MVRGCTVSFQSVIYYVIFVKYYKLVEVWIEFLFSGCLAVFAGWSCKLFPLSVIAPLAYR